MCVGLTSREREGISPALVPMMPHAIVGRRPLTSDFPAMCRDSAGTPLEFFSRAQDALRVHNHCIRCYPLPPLHCHERRSGLCRVFIGYPGPGQPNTAHPAGVIYTHSTYRERLFGCSWRSFRRMKRQHALLVEKLRDSVPVAISPPRRVDAHQ